MNVRTILFILALFSLTTIGIGGSAFYLHVKNTEISEARENSERTVSALGGQISVFLDRQRRVSQAIAGSPVLREAFPFRHKESWTAINALLDHTCNALEAAVCYLMNTEGTTVASSNRDTPTSFVGKNYAFRPYFNEALIGKSAIYLALGVTSKKRGIYFSSPVTTQQGVVRGVVVIKAPVEDLENHFMGVEGIAVLIDAKGMVFASNQPDWLYHGLWALSEHEAEVISKTRQYGSNKPEWIGLREIMEGRAFHPDGRIFLTASKKLALPEGWQVTYFHDTASIHVFGPENSFSNTVIFGFGFVFLITGFVVVFLFRFGVKDLSRLKTTENNLRANQQLLETLIDTVPDGIYIKDLEGRYIMANKSFAAIHKKTPEEVVGLKAEDFEFFSEEEKNIVIEMDKEAIRSQGFVEDKEVKRKRADGSISTFHILKTVLRDEAHDVSGIVGVATDITSRVQAENDLRESLNQLRLITDNLPVLIIYIDLDHRYRFVNQEASNWYSQDAENILGKTMEDVLGAQFYNRIKPRLEEVMSGSPVHFEEQAQYPDGKDRHIEVTYVPDFDESGSTRGVFGFVQDITEKREMEAHLRQSENLKAVGQLAGGIAHEFNNLLQMIMGFNELTMEKLPKSDPVFKNLEKIKGAAKRGGALVKQLLGFSRREMLRPTVIDVNDLISSLGTFLKSTLGEQISLRLELDEEPLKIKADKGAIEQIVLNLVINARDAMKEGGDLIVQTSRVSSSSVTVQDRDRLKAEDYILIKLMDSGEGMAEEVKDHIFEPFFTTKGPQEGSGLGLSMVYGLVEQHEGLTEVSSQPGKGTTFDIYLPAYTGLTPKVETGRKPSSKSKKGLGTILVADDEEAIQALTAATLEQEGYTVLVASGGKEAMELFDTHKAEIELVLLDLIMPNVGGIDVYKHIQKTDTSMPVVFQTGFNLNSENGEFISKQGLTVLTKPYSMTELKKTVMENLTG